MSRLETLLPTPDPDDERDVLASLVDPLGQLLLVRTLYGPKVRVLIAGFDVPGPPMRAVYGPAWPTAHVARRWTERLN